MLRAARWGTRRAGSGSAQPPSPTRRLHVAARLEDGFDRALAAVLERRGWTVRVETFAGYGAPGWVRVLARTLLAPPSTRSSDLPGAGGEAQVDARPAPSVRGWRSFATAQVAGARVTVRVGSLEHEVATDRGGYLDVVLDSDLPPGWHHVEITTQDGATSRAPVLVVDPEARVGLVSDIDDTVMVTRLPRPLVAAWNVLVRHESAREPVPGMADLYAELRRRNPGMPVVYLSTGAWNAAPAIARFLHRYGYPAGPLLLTDWGPTNTGWFRSGRAHKVGQLRRLFHELPDVRWVLVGDDGQRDPEIYAGAATHHPDHVRAILLRQLTFSEHVLAHGLPAPTPEARTAERAAVREGMPVVQGADGYVLRRAVGPDGLRST
ncbi:DUF2183 domain-containing protein [Cellulomonas fimi]|nr:DUF2183 domain-containing protein [Cellulomonas fimi]